MAGKKISALPVAPSLNQADLLVAVDLTKAVALQTQQTTLAKVRQMSDGTVLAPGFPFIADSKLGLYRPAANKLSIASNGINIATFEDIGIGFFSGISALNPDGSGIFGLITFQGDGTLFNPGITLNPDGSADFLGISITAGGALVMGSARVLSVASGANQRAGNLTLVGGAKTIANTTVTANTIVLLTRKTSGGTPGTAISYTLNAGVGFTVTSDNALDASTYSYLLIEVP